MSLEPLLAAPLSTQVHAFAAMAAFALGAVQLAAPKGTLPHRTVGWLWVALMVTVAASSFWIHDLRVWGRWSPIHLLSIFNACNAAACGRARAAPPHRAAPQRLIAIFTGALVVAGLFTLLPGRIIHAVVFGN